MTATIRQIEISEPVAEGFRMAVLEAIGAEAKRLGGEGSPLFPGDEVMAGINDAMAMIAARSPRCATIRDRREYLDWLADRLKRTVVALQAEDARAQGAVILRPGAGA